MTSVVFILGAGASAQCGAPLMGNFLDVARDLLLSGKVKDKDKRKQFERVFYAIGKLQAVHSKAQLDLTNIESIFTVLELSRVIRSFPGLKSEDIGSTISALKELIVTTLEQRINFPCNEELNSKIDAPEPYNEFAALLKYLRTDAAPSQTASVITFNYDLAADVAIFNAGMWPDYVIDGLEKREPCIQLMKLHGSLNWATEKESRNIKSLSVLDYFRGCASSIPYEKNKNVLNAQLDVGSKLQRSFRECHGSSIKIDSEPVIVPPSWNKADYHCALSDVWAAAAKNLSEAEYIFVIGYSLPETDSFFRHLYALGSVGDAPLRKIIIYNPEPSGDGVDTRFRALLGPGAISRYEYRPIKFGEAIGEIEKIFPS